MEPADAQELAYTRAPTVAGHNGVVLFELLAAILFLLAVLCLTVGGFVADFLLTRALLGFGLVGSALGLLFEGLSCIVLYRHPEQISRKTAERFRRLHITAREHAVGLACYCLICAPALAVLAVSVFTGVIFTAPMAEMGIVAGVVLLIAITPVIIVRMRGLRRRG